jgi:hypothetical protein
MRWLALLLLAACAQDQVNTALGDVVKSPAERCQEAKDIIATFIDPTTQELALVVAACVP